MLSAQTSELVKFFSSPSKQNKASEIRFIELQCSSGSRWPVILYLTTRAGSHKYTLCTDIVRANILACWMYGLESQMLRKHPEHCASVACVEAR